MAELSTELYWDHGGESLGDISPFTTENDENTPLHRSKRDEGMNLNYLQTLQLIQNLEETSDILRSYLSEIDADLEKKQASREQSSGTPTYGNRCRDYMCKKCLSVLRTVTGTKTIIFTVILQGINLLIQTIIDFLPQNDTNAVLEASSATMIILQLINLVLIIITSTNLARQMISGIQPVSWIFLIQSYIATLLLFAGLYTITKRLKPSSWKYLREDVDDPVYIAIIYCKFLYFSVSTGTLCGNVDITPYDWYNCIFVSMQMLLSFMYFASILGHACMPLHSAKKDRVLSRLASVNSHRGSRAPSRILTPNHSSSRLLEADYANYGSTVDRSEQDDK
ncbi:uncharacterized protein LOC134693403 isoform X1 [Mytilus trossulus]|uniref:uncharacterized protein LOC134693403 isoform X1 n=1 Tax=Mytilus trossulus TaxID=6551 RepID=UPI003007E74A